MSFLQHTFGSQSNVPSISIRGVTIHKSPASIQTLVLRSQFGSFLVQFGNKYLIPGLNHMDCVFKTSASTTGYTLRSAAVETQMPIPAMAGSALLQCFFPCSGDTHP